jgi:hypothetical protein
MISLLVVLYVYIYGASRSALQASKQEGPDRHTPATRSWTYLGTVPCGVAGVVHNPVTASAITALRPRVAGSLASFALIGHGLSQVEAYEAARVVRALFAEAGVDEDRFLLVAGGGCAEPGGARVEVFAASQGYGSPRGIVARTTRA